MRTNLVSALLAGTALTLSAQALAVPQFDANTRAAVGGNQVVNENKNTTASDVTSDSFASGGSNGEQASANASATSGGFVFADAAISASGSESFFFEGTEVLAMSARGEATFSNSFSNSGPEASFSLQVTLPDHDVDGSNILEFDDQEQFSTAVSTIWSLNGSEIWSFTFGLQSAAGGILEQVDERTGSGLFPVVDCDFMNDQVASCTLTDATALIDLGTIGAGEEFELSVTVIAEASAPGRTVDRDFNPFDEFGVFDFGTIIRLSDPAELLPSSPSFLTSAVGVPEPASTSLLGLGLLGLAWARRRSPATA